METNDRRLPRLRATYLLDLGWAEDLWYAVQLRTSSCMFSPDPLFSHNSGGFKTVRHDDPELQATRPSTVTNLGLSISLPMCFTKPFTLPTRATGLGSPYFSLAIIEPCREMSAQSEFPVLNNNWINCLGFVVSTSTGRPLQISRRADLMLNGMDGQLLSMSIPGHLFKRHFPLVVVFVSGSQYLHIYPEMRPPDLGGLNL